MGAISMPIGSRVHGRICAVLLVGRSLRERIVAGPRSATMGRRLLFRPFCKRWVAGIQAIHISYWGPRYVSAIFSAG